eukprot:9447856-Alexandrium_andersonii.AAC.1
MSLTSAGLRFPRSRSKLAPRASPGCLHPRARQSKARSRFRAASAVAAPPLPGQCRLARGLFQQCTAAGSRSDGEARASATPTAATSSTTSAKNSWHSAV